MFRILIISIMLFSFVFRSKAQSLKLNFEPREHIIVFHFDSLTVYTDTTSLYYIYSQYGKKKFQTYKKEETFEIYYSRVKNLIDKKFSNSKNDTAVFDEEDFSRFDDSLSDVYTSIYNNQISWDFYWAVVELAKEKKLKIVDRRGNLVKVVTTKKVGTKKGGVIEKRYLNKDSGEVLFL
jgi:hypothetical protein